MRKVVYSARVEKKWSLKTTDYTLIKDLNINEFCDVHVYLVPVDETTEKEKEIRKRRAEKRFNAIIKKGKT